MRTIYWYLNFVVTLVLKTPELLTMKKKSESMKTLDFYSLINKTAQKWAMLQIKASGGTFHVLGNENIPKDEPVLFVSNHQGNFDIAIFLSLIDKDKAYIAKIEILKIPLLRTWMKYLGCIFMDRSDMKKSAQAILEGINTLKSGYSLVIFPEGTRSKSDKTNEFKSGSLKLATKSKATIVPVTISGSYKLMEANNNRIKPAEVFITIHKPIKTSELTQEQLIELPKKVEEVICSALPLSKSQD